MTAHVAGEPAAAVLINNWGDADDDALRSTGALSARHARSVVARDHGFSAWPDLIARRSAYGHHAALLHYTAANGVEIRRQVVPANAAEVTATLLDSGADASARFHAYGGMRGTLSMLRSSAHPRAAGVSAQIEALLRR